MDTQTYRVSGRKVRQVVDAQSKALDSLPAVLRGLEARILTNDHNMRVRVDAISQTQAAFELSTVTFWQRLRWLVRGV